MKTIYMDHAAATPLSEAVSKAMAPFWQERFFNPSATYQAAREVRAALEAARAKAAAAIGVSQHEVIFTAGATEANNLAIHGVMQRFPGKKVLLSAIEHDSVLAPAAQYAHELIPVDKYGLVDPQALERLIDDDTVLISVMWANNELGTIQPLASVRECIRKEIDRRIKTGNTLPLYLHSDAAQAMNYVSVFPHKSHVDLLSLNGGKIYGPKQSGLLYVNKQLELDPLILGGGQERGLRSGTENVPAIMGLAEALDETLRLRPKEKERLQHLQLHFIKALLELPGAVVNNQGAPTIPNIVHVRFEGQDNERLMMELDSRGLQCAVGSACSASNDEPSHVLMAIGMTDQEAQGSLRFSMGRSTTKNDIDQAITALKEILGA